MLYSFFTSAIMGHFLPVAIESQRSQFMEDGWVVWAFLESVLHEALGQGMVSA